MTGIKDELKYLFQADGRYEAGSGYSGGQSLERVLLRLLSFRSGVYGGNDRANGSKLGGRSQEKAFFTVRIFIKGQMKKQEMLYYILAKL